MRFSAHPLMAPAFAGLMSLSAVMVPGARGAEFTAAQRAEIGAILRDALKQDPSILRDAIVALQNDDTEREKMSNRSAVAATRDLLVTANDPVAGNPRGDVTIVEFFDIRCPYCRKFEPEMAAFLASDRNVRLVYKDLPILGAASVLGSRALLAAQRQNAYEKMHDVVMRMPGEITRPALEAEAKKLGLDVARLLQDMESPGVKDQIDANLRLAHVLKIQGTPAMVIGDDILPGAVGVEDLKRAVAEVRAARR